MKATVGGTGRRGKEKDKSLGGGSFRNSIFGFSVGGERGDKSGSFWGVL